MGKEDSKLACNAPSEDGVSSSRILPSHLIENVVLIWLDPNLEASQSGSHRALTQLQQTVNCIKLFTDLDRCGEFLTTIRNEKIVLLLSGSCVEQALSRLRDTTHISAIFIFCRRTSNYQSLTNQCTKIKCIDSRIESICEILKQEIDHTDRELTPVSIVNVPSVINLNELNPSFMYSQLLNEVLLDMNYEDSGRSEFVHFCRVQYADNDTELKVVDEFERDYRLHTPIWWYTRDCFLYLILNQALHLQDIEIIIKMGFCIRDLHEQIRDLHAQVFHRQSLTVCRGQSFTDDNFERQRNSKDALLSFHSFLSTSTDRNTSIGFARRAVSHRTDVTGILFRIKTDPAVSSAPCASLDDISCYSDTEHGSLFSMHTIFRIGATTKLDEKLWQVNLTLTSDDDEQLNCLTTHIRRTIAQPTSLRRLAKLMLDMDVLDKAEEIYTRMLETARSDNPQGLSFVHNQLGFIAEKRHDLSAALGHYDKSLQIGLAYLSENHPDLPAAYSNIGEIHRQQGHLEAAIQHYEKAIHTEQDSAQPDYINLATFYNNLGMVCEQQGKHSEALRHYEHTLELELAHLPPRHPNSARTCNNIAGVYYSLKDYPTALTYLEKLGNSTEISSTNAHFTGTSELEYSARFKCT